MLLFATCLAAIAALVTAASLLGFNPDLAIAGLFYDPAAKDFVAGKDTHYALLRDHGLVAVMIAPHSPRWRYGPRAGDCRTFPVAPWSFSRSVC